jgi:hypothetical protein
MRKDITTPTPTEIGILHRLEGCGVKRAEAFYITAKRLRNPLDAIETGGIAEVQSFLLMTMFMLTASKRNTAWSYLGKSIHLRCPKSKSQVPLQEQCVRLLGQRYGLANLLKR